MASPSRFSMVLPNHVEDAPSSHHVSVDASTHPLVTPNDSHQGRVPCMALLGGRDLTRGSLCHHIPVVLNVMSEAVCRDRPKTCLLKILARLCFAPHRTQTFPTLRQR